MIAAYRISGQRRRSIVPLLALACLLSGAGRAFAADAATDKSKQDGQKQRTEILATRDGWNLHLTYWPSESRRDAPVVVLLHDKFGNRVEWTSLAQKLQQEGYAVVAADLRGHGESKGLAPAAGESSASKGKGKKTPKGVSSSTAVGESEDGEYEVGSGTVAARSKGKKGPKTALDVEHFGQIDYERMVTEDLETIKDFIYREHQQERLNMNKMAIVGAGMGASVAVFFAKHDWQKEPHDDGVGASRTPRGQDVRALVLLSPSLKTTGLPLSKAINDIRTPEFNIAVLVGVGKTDSANKGDAKKIFSQLTPTTKHKDRMYFEEYPSPKHGTELLAANMKAEDHILTFLDEHLKKLSSTWRDRQSKLEKKPNP